MDGKKRILSALWQVDGVLREPMIKIALIPARYPRFGGEAGGESVNKILEAQCGIRV